MTKTLSAPQETEGFDFQKNGGLVKVRTALRGASPLLLNAMSHEALLGLRNKTKPAKNASKPTPREEAESKLYRTPSGTPCVPGQNLYSSMIAAGCFVRLDGKRQVSTRNETLLPGFMMLEEMLLPLYIPGTDKPAQWEVDVAQGRNPNGGEAVCIVRPRFDAWEIRPTFQVDLNEFTMEQARRLVDISSNRIGLCDRRPQKKGTFGRYQVFQWDVERDIG